MWQAFINKIRQPEGKPRRLVGAFAQARIDAAIKNATRAVSTLIGKKSFNAFFLENFFYISYEIFNFSI